MKNFILNKSLLAFLSFNILVFFCMLFGFSNDNSNAEFKNYQDTLKNKKAFKIDIDLDSKFYLVGELFMLKVRFTNQSPHRDSLSYISIVELNKYMRLNGIKNGSPPKFFPDIFYGGSPYTIFEPYESKEEEVNLNMAFNYDKNDEEDVHFLPEDDYTISLIYPVKEEAGSYIKSNSIKFSVQYPTKDEELYQSLKKVYSNKFSLKEKEGIIDETEKLMFQNYDSKYFDALYVAISSFKNSLNYKFDDTFVDQALEIIKRNPNSYSAQSACEYSYYILKREKNAEKLNSYINNLNNLYPNSKTTKFLNEKILKK